MPMYEIAESAGHEEGGVFRGEAGGGWNRRSTETKPPVATPSSTPDPSPAGAFNFYRRPAGSMVGVLQQLVLAGIDDDADALLALPNLGDKKVRATTFVQKALAGLLPDLGLPTLAVPFLSWDSSRTITRAAARRTNNARSDTLCSFARIVRRGGEEGWW
jgi:hypothetical protein